MNERGKAVLDHLKKYTLSSDKIINMSDEEWNQHLNESRDDWNDIESKHPSKKIYSE